MATNERVKLESFLARGRATAKMSVGAFIMGTAIACSPMATSIDSSRINDSGVDGMGARGSDWTADRSADGVVPLEGLASSSSSEIAVGELAWNGSESEVAAAGLNDSGNSLAVARVLVPSSASNPGIELFDDEVSNTLLIRGEFKDGDYKVSRFSAPDRVVVDLLSTPGKMTRVFNTDDAGYVQKVRLGAHPDRSRVVMDLTQGVELSHNAELTPEGLSVVVYSPNIDASNSETKARFVPVAANEQPVGVMAVEVMPVEVMAVEVMAVEVMDGDAELGAISSDGVAGDSIALDDTVGSPALGSAAESATESTESVDRKAISADRVTPEQEMNLSPHVSAVSIETLGGGENSVIAQVSSAGFFSLKRTAPSEYVLSVEGATIDPQAQVALLAPAESGAIRSVRAVSQGNDVLLRIFTSSDATLEARPMPAIDESGATRIVVSRAYPAGSRAADARAQAEAAPGEPAAADSQDVAANPAADADTEVDADIASLLQESPQYTGRLISLDLQDTDIDNALRIIAEVSNLNIIASEDVTGKVTLRLIDVPWDQALDVILKTNGLDKVQEGNVVRIAPVEKLRQEREALKQAREAEDSLEPLKVKYARISYGRAAEMKPLVESVLSERGSAAYDERTNQLIVKDIQRGLKNVAELIAKVDLRTPQVLLETQIIEAKRNLMRDLGAELGFTYIRSPETGNATGRNFPNSINVGGGLDGGSASSFPAAVSSASGAAVSMLFGSADGSKSLDMRISALEQDGRIRVVSRPAVATTNNKQALIKSVEKIRVKLPSGGTSVATGQGATAAGGASTATETIEIGIELQVTPQASPDYYVLLDLKAKSSTFGAQVVDGIPSEVERSANSTVLVSSGQTFAMGGIYKTEDFSSVTGVPFLKDIPVLGALFRLTNVSNADEELLFFITPRIIEGSFDDAAMRASS